MFANVFAAACVLLLVLGGVVWATGDTTRDATSLADALRAAIATAMGAADGNGR